MRLPSALRLLPFAVLLLAGCGSGPVDVQTAESVPLKLDRSNPLRLVRSVLGAYAGGDAVETGLVSGEGDDLTLHPQKLDPALRAHLTDTNGDGAIGWDELSAFLKQTYARGHGLPETLAALHAEAGTPAADSSWFAVDIDGSVMTHARRHVVLKASAVRAALASAAAGEGLHYPAGTVIYGEHLADGAVVETTVKRRRADGFWDFAVYDAQGRLAPTTTTDPKPLAVPTQCTGCHLGRKAFEPEAAFPASPADGVDGPRRYVVPEAWRSAAATTRLDEHARRDDGVLGLYATLYTGRLLAARTDGTATPADLALLTRLGL